MDLLKKLSVGTWCQNICMYSLLACCGYIVFWLITYNHKMKNEKYH